MFGLNMLVAKETVFIGDTSVNEYPSSKQLADIAISAARVVRLFGFVQKLLYPTLLLDNQLQRTKHIRDGRYLKIEECKF